MSASPTISVIIPTLNEADELSATLRHAQAIDGLHEIIVVDAGSTDSTRDLARAAGCHVIHSQPNRGLQQRLGAQHATGDIILFLHADTWLPHDAGKTIRQILAKPNVVAGAFQKRFRDRGALPGSRIRCWLLWKWFNKFFGDQAIFVKRHALEQAGGMPAVPLMEEYELCKALAPHGKLALTQSVVETSPRKMANEGTLKTYLRMTICTICYACGISPYTLISIYFSKEPMKPNESCKQVDSASAI